MSVDFSPLDVCDYSRKINNVFANVDEVVTEFEKSGEGDVIAVGFGQALQDLTDLAVQGIGAACQPLSPPGLAAIPKRFFDELASGSGENPIEALAFFYLVLEALDIGGHTGARQIVNVVFLIGILADRDLKTKSFSGGIKKHRESKEIHNPENPVVAFATTNIPDLWKAQGTSETPLIAGLLKRLFEAYVHLDHAEEIYDNGAELGSNLKPLGEAIYSSMRHLLLKWLSNPDGLVHATPPPRKAAKSKKAKKVVENPMEIDE